MGSTPGLSNWSTGFDRQPICPDELQRYRRTVWACCSVEHPVAGIPRMSAAVCRAPSAERAVKLAVGLQAELLRVASTGLSQRS